ncbi:ABC transporter ATP-binding protein [Cupriavidus sp. SS-3]|uniref:ABC transporter ATP-binding protein n=1 Tax=Cupriavidus sp. SS-3 TaxID=3109596 RepID=UPI002DBA7AF2|nr:ABC transporter ATP-binding protein [Cupriavidus sp. SS-3]MEC3767078.1 ABC transporter ATP-binding protein [Cupriavidus sp. SS-3]
MTPLLSLQDLSIRYPGGARPAVSGLSLDVGAGETVALVGESGCGKSTTALGLLRLLPATAQVSGRVLLEGRDLLTLRERDMTALRGNAVSMIFQEPMTSLNPVLSVGAQVVETLRLHTALSVQAAHARAVELLDQVRIPEPQRRFHAYPHQLSGGQRQRVMIAMAIACTPKLLVADEPTTALDVTVQAQILELLDTLRRELRMAMLLITHDLGVVARWADRVAVMHDGIKVEEQPARALFREPAHAYTRGLLGASLSAADGVVPHYRQVRLPEIRVDRRADGTPAAFRLERPALRPAGGHATASAPTLLEVEDLHVTHRSGAHATVAVQGVSFSIAAGETVGLVGESGCGKSTLARAVLRLADHDAGRIVFDGTDIAPVNRRRMRPWRGAMQLVFQDPYSSLNPRKTVAEVLEGALRIHGVRDRQERRARAAAMIDRVGLPAAALHRYPHEFSGGQRQRIGIARALIVRPRLLVCDEPVSALDVSVQAQVLNLLADLQAEYGLSCLFISHDLGVVRYIADRILVMREGRLVESGDRDEIWNRPAHPYTRQLLAAVPRALPAQGRAPLSQHAETHASGVFG